MIIDMGLYSKPELAKMIKGYIGRHIFQLMPWLKQKYFWGSGFWNPSYDIRNVNDMGFYPRYLDKQKYAANGQKTLAVFC